VSLAGWERGGRDLPDLLGIAEALAGPAHGFGELGGVGAHPIPELAVLAARSGEHGHEPSALRIDVAHLLTRAQLRIGDVEKPRAAGQCPQLVPRVDVGAVVVHVPRGEAMGQRDRSVSGDGQDQHELLQIGTMILGMPACRQDGRFAATLMAVRSVVVTVQHQRRGIVV